MTILVILLLNKLTNSETYSYLNIIWSCLDKVGYSSARHNLCVSWFKQIATKLI